MHLIFREGKSDRRHRIYSRGNPDKGIAGVARNVDEAAELSYHDGEDGGLYVVGGGKEREKAFIDDMKRIGQDPERVKAEWGKGGILLPDEDGKVKPDTRKVIGT